MWTFTALVFACLTFGFAGWATFIKDAMSNPAPRSAKALFALTCFMTGVSAFGFVIATLHTVEVLG